MEANAPNSTLTNQQATATAAKGRTGGLTAVMRFDLDLQAKGALKPGKPVHITVKARAHMPTQQANLKIVLPEVAALQKGMGRGRGVLVRGKPIPPRSVWYQGFGRGQALQRQVTVRIEKPGYYQVIASVVAETKEVKTEDGQWIKNSAARDIWLWIDEDGGKVTEEFDRSLFPDVVRKQPGPLTLKSELPAITVAQLSGAKLRTNSISGSTMIYVDYINQATGVAEPLKGARVSYTIYDGRGLQRDNSTKVIGSNGTITIPCYADEIYGPGTYAGTVHVQDNYRLRVYHPQTNSDVVAHFSGDFATDCGQQIPVRAAYKMSHVFMRMSETIEKSRSFFQEERGKMHVHLEWDVNNSYYCSGFNPIPDHPCSNGGDIIIIKDSFDPGGDSHVGGSFGDFVVAHEYGHAMHEKALGGNTGGNCPTPHYIDGAHNLTCAFSEGFADYHGVVVFNSYIRAGIEYNDYYPAEHGGGNPSAGSIIEGAVAAFLWDVTDPANESHDNAGYPGSYVADIIKTCRVDDGAWRRANGIDHLIACFQRDVPSYSGYFPTRGDIPNDFSENVAEPSGWNRSNVRELWHVNLYGESTPVSPVEVSIIGPNHIDETGTYTWEAIPDGGNGIYSYIWEYQPVGFDWSEVGSQRTYSKDFWPYNNNDFRLRVTVTSGNETASRRYYVNVSLQSRY